MFAQDGSPRASTPTMRPRRASFSKPPPLGEVSGAKTGSVFAPRLCPSPPKCGRRFGFAENGDSRGRGRRPRRPASLLRRVPMTFFGFAPTMRLRHASFSKPPPLGEVSRLAVTEGVRLILPAKCKSNRWIRGGDKKEKRESVYSGRREIPQRKPPKHK